MFETILTIEQNCRRCYTCVRDCPAKAIKIVEEQASVVAERCVECGNCTMACPTCFCGTVEDITDLPGRSAQRWWVWDSCFTATHSYLHGGSVRLSTLSRYRQWLTHKLASWQDQFGLSGCVGCGRCITWCPAGIDITAEVAAVAAAPRHAVPGSEGQERT